MTDPHFTASHDDRIALLERNLAEITRQFVTVVKDLAELNKVMRSWSANYPPLGRITKTLQERQRRLQNLKAPIARG